MKEREQKMMAQYRGDQDVRSGPVLVKLKIKTDNYLISSLLTN